MKTIMKVGRNGAKRVEIQIRGFHPAFVAREGQPLTSIESEE